MMEEKHVFDKIQEHLVAGGEVLIATHTRATLYQAKHAGFFFKPKNVKEKGVYVQSGKKKVYVFPYYIRFQ